MIAPSRLAAVVALAVAARRLSDAFARTHCAVRSGPLRRRLQQCRAGLLARADGRRRRRTTGKAIRPAACAALRHRSARRTRPTRCRQRRRSRRRRAVRVVCRADIPSTSCWSATRRPPPIRAPDYVLPTGDVVPHMQRGARGAHLRRRDGALSGAAVLARARRQPDVRRLHQRDQASSRARVMLSSRRSTATRASPTSSSRASTTRSTRCVHFKDFVAMQALRPLSLSLALDALLGQPALRDHVDRRQRSADSARASAANRCC